MPPSSTHTSFFPPPLRLSRAPQEPAPRKRPRFCFTSDLTYGRDYVFPRYNPDGSENVDWMRMQSMLALKSKWDGICDKFKDAHLLPQDEIYLGRGPDGVQLLKDRGHLRAIRRTVPFGYFIAQNERQDAQQAREHDDLDAWAGELPIPPRAEMDQGPDLEEFLAAERRRKALLGLNSDDEEDDECEEDVVDFTDPKWGSQIEVEDDGRDRCARSTPECDLPGGGDDFDPLGDSDAASHQPLHADCEEDDPLRLSTPFGDLESGSEGDELDLLPDKSTIPDLSSFGLTMLESLIRRENARLAPKGYMLAEDDEVHDLAVALASGSHRSTSVMSDFSVREPASDSTLVDASPWSARSESTCLASSPAPSLLSPPPRSSPTFILKGKEKHRLPLPAPTPPTWRILTPGSSDDVSPPPLGGAPANTPTPASCSNSDSESSARSTTPRIRARSPVLPTSAPAKASRRTSNPRPKRKRSSLQVGCLEPIAPPALCGGPGVCAKTFCFSCRNH